MALLVEDLQVHLKDLLRNRADGVAIEAGAPVLAVVDFLFQEQVPSVGGVFRIHRRRPVIARPALECDSQQSLLL